MAALTGFSSITSTTAKVNLQYENDEWNVIFVGILIVVISLAFAFVLIALVYRIFCHERENKKNLPDDSFGRGIRNLGNTCYFNAAIQCLASTPILKSLVPQIASEDEYLINEFLKFLSPIDPENGSVSNPLDPKPLLEAFCAKATRFRGSQQHDCHELLRHFLDQLRQEERASWKNGNPRQVLTAVDKVFGGHFMTAYICKTCKEPYHVCEPFLDISVPICVGDLTTSEKSEERQEEETDTESASPYQQAMKSIMERLSLRPVDIPAKIMSITDCLRYFTRQKMLGQQYMCKSCGNDSSPSNPDLLQIDPILTHATKQTLIFNPPAVLVIHLKRFEMKGSKFEKRNNMIKFEELLDLAPFCSAWCQRNESREQNIWYSLYAVVVHSGTLNHGHYVAYIKERGGSTDDEKFLQNVYFDRDVTADQLVEMMQNLKQKGRPTIYTKYSVPLDNYWYCMNDSRVSRVPVKEVLRKEAFLLFYERVSPVG